MKLIWIVLVTATFGLAALLILGFAKAEFLLWTLIGIAGVTAVATPFFVRTTLLRIPLGVFAVCLLALGILVMTYGYFNFQSAQRNLSDAMGSALQQMASRETTQSERMQILKTELDDPVTAKRRAVIYFVMGTAATVAGVSCGIARLVGGNKNHSTPDRNA